MTLNGAMPTVKRLLYLARNREEQDVMSRVSDYTYEEFVNEFQKEVCIEDMYDDDVRIEADYKILDSGTYEAGGLPDKQYLTVGSRYLSIWCVSCQLCCIAK